jgi:hypothetical protein
MEVCTCPILAPSAATVCRNLGLDLNDVSSKPTCQNAVAHEIASEYVPELFLGKYIIY